jgi:hypothetical protein
MAYAARRFDPALVAFERNLYWAKCAHADPLAVLREDAGVSPPAHEGHALAGGTGRHAHWVLLGAITTSDRHK